MIALDWAMVGALSSLGATAIYAALLALGVWQIREVRVERQAQARARKQITLEMCRDVSIASRQVRQELITKYGIRGLQSDEQLDRFLAHPNDVFLLRGLLNELERLSVGVQHNVYDIEIVDDLVSSVIRGWWHRYMLYIVHVQGLDPGARTYESLGGLVSRLESRYMERRGERQPSA